MIVFVFGSAVTVSPSVRTEAISARPPGVFRPPSPRGPVVQPAAAEPAVAAAGQVPEPAAEAVEALPYATAAAKVVEITVAEEAAVVQAPLQPLDRQQTISPGRSPVSNPSPKVAEAEPPSPAMLRIVRSTSAASTFWIR